jgi:hypothetical protein
MFHGCYNQVVIITSLIWILSPVEGPFYSWTMCGWCIIFFQYPYFLSTNSFRLRSHCYILQGRWPIGHLCHRCVVVSTLVDWGQLHISKWASALSRTQWAADRWLLRCNSSSNSLIWCCVCCSLQLREVQGGARWHDGCKMFVKISNTHGKLHSHVSTIYVGCQINFFYLTKASADVFFE